MLTPVVFLALQVTVLPCEGLAGTFVRAHSGPASRVIPRTTPRGAVPLGVVPAGSRVRSHPLPSGVAVSSGITFWPTTDCTAESCGC